METSVSTLVPSTNVETTTPRLVSVNKSTLALFKGLGKDTNYIAEYFNISVNDARKLMEQAGLTKARIGKNKQPEYTIQYVDDVTTTSINA